MSNYYLIGEIGADGTVTSLTMELAGLCSGLSSGAGGSFKVLLFGVNLNGAAESLADYGFDVLVLEDKSFTVYNPELYLGALKVILEKEDDFAVIAGHTSLGQDLIPRLSYALGGAAVTDCIGLDLDGGSNALLCKRYLYGGNALATQRINSRIAAVTVRPRVGVAPEKTDSAGKIEYQKNFDSGEPAVKITGSEMAEKELELEDASVIVAGGRGMGSKEGFREIDALARILNGAVGTSRPPVDSGWVDPTRQIGITGKIVAPDLYFAVGLSGSSQHISGMSESGVVVAINKDSNSFIFSVSDYGVKGEWQQVLPAFTARLKELIS